LSMSFPGRKPHLFNVAVTLLFAAYRSSSTWQPKFFAAKPVFVKSILAAACAAGELQFPPSLIAASCAALVWARHISYTFLQEARWWEFVVAPL